MIRIFKASDYYPSFQTFFYKSNPDVLHFSYKKHLNSLFDICFSESNFFKINLEKTGKTKVEEVLSGDEKLQKKWAKENNISYNEENWFFDILEKQLCEFKPDVFFAHHQKALDPNFIRKIKKLLPNLQLIVGWEGIGNFNTQLFSMADILFTPLDSFTIKFNKLGIKTYTLPFAFENSILKKLTSKPKVDISFIGSVHLRDGGHRKRKELLNYLNNNIDIELFLSGSTEISDNLFSKSTLSSLYRNGISDFIDLYKLGKKSKGSLYGLDMYEKMYNSKIVLNNHLDSAGNMGGNIRLFEATGCGSCLLTDNKINLHEFFEIDKEIVVYNTHEDCIEKINYLLNNESKRNEIALAGQTKTLKKYSYEQRSENFLKILMEYI